MLINQLWNTDCVHGLQQIAKSRNPPHGNVVSLGPPVRIRGATMHHGLDHILLRGR